MPNPSENDPTLAFHPNPREIDLTKKLIKLSE